MDQQNYNILVRNTRGLNVRCRHDNLREADVDKIEFFDELRSIQTSIGCTWMIAGDFSLLDASSSSGLTGDSNGWPRLRIMYNIS